MSALTHGTLNRYLRGKCRCVPCRTAYATHEAQTKARKQARGECMNCPRPLAATSTSRCERCLEYQRRVMKARRPKTAQPRPRDLSDTAINALFLVAQANQRRARWRSDRSTL